MRELTLPRPEVRADMSPEEVRATVEAEPTFQEHMARVMEDEGWTPEPFEAAVVDGELYWWHPAVEDPYGDPDSDEPTRVGRWVLPNFTVPG